jgi:hypothetical protein
MSHTEFLIGASGQRFGNLSDAIYKLEDLSTIFMKRWASGDAMQASAVSEEAMRCFDFVVGELMRARDDRKTQNIYSGSQFEAEMNRSVALMVKPVTVEEQSAIYQVGPGNGALPRRPFQPVTITLEVTLNKLKHRNGVFMNFRIDNNRHILLICPTGIGGRPESVVEFDVEDFCRRSRAAASAL